MSPVSAVLLFQNMLDVVLPIALLISTSVTVAMLMLPARYEVPTRPNVPETAKEPVSRAVSAANTKTSVQVLVLGDIGRSPRMQNHALSIAKCGGRVDLIGYLGIFA